MSPEDAVDALSPEGRATPSAVPGDSVTVPPGDASGDANLRGEWIDFDFFSTTDLVIRLLKSLSRQATRPRGRT